MDFIYLCIYGLNPTYGVLWQSVLQSRIDKSFGKSRDFRFLFQILNKASGSADVGQVVVFNEDGGLMVLLQIQPGYQRQWF